MSKLMPLKQAISEYVSDGDVLYAAGFTHLIPFAAGHEIIRQGKKNLTLARATDGAETLTQVSRLSMPLVNEVVIGLRDKDKFNASEPKDDLQFADPALRERLFARIVRSLKPGGTLLLQGYTPRQLDYKTGGPPILSHLYTEAMLREAFAALDITVLRDYEAEVHEGSGHHGMSALIGLVAVKR